MPPLLKILNSSHLSPGRTWPLSYLWTLKAGVGMEALNSFQGSANPAVTHEALSGGQLTP